MLILELALAAMLSTRGTVPQTAAQSPRPPVMRPFTVALLGPDLARAIKKDLEAISGPGSVEVSVDHETLFSVRIAVPSLRREIYNPIYDRALELYRIYPDLSFDFYLRLKPGSSRH